MKLAAVIDQYMKFRQDLGKGLDKSARDILLSYCRNVGRGMDIAKIRPEQASSFLNGNGPVTSYWHRKHSLLVGFYRYAVSRGQVNCSPLPVLLPKRPGPFSPYLYSRTELRQLLDGTAGFHRNHVKLESHTLRAIVLLLYGAGLRCCEALGLTLMDVDVQQACLTIRHTKFHKTRLVPLGAKLNQAMGKYARRRKRDGHSQKHEAPFFVLRSGAAVTRGIVEAAFARLRDFVGVRRTDGARYQPRLHDLRHSFAADRLIAWYRQGKDVQKLLPHLATYMGHVEIASTQVYLATTPALLQEASTRFEKYALGEVHHG